jgi:hypothetical protein
MRDRRRDGDWIWLIAELVGVLLLFGLISPEIRQTICAAGVLAVCAVSIAGTGLIGFGIYRFVARSQSADDREHTILDSVGCSCESGAEAPPDDFPADRTAGLDEPVSALASFSERQKQSVANADLRGSGLSDGRALIHQLQQP